MRAQIHPAENQRPTIKTPRFSDRHNTFRPDTLCLARNNLDIRFDRFQHMLDAAQGTGD